MQHRYVFVLGCPRSGTTMLQQALNRHSEIVIPPETKFFFSLLGHSKRCQAGHIQRLRRDLGIALPSPGRRIRCRRDAAAFFELISCRYLERLNRANVIYFGDKTPEHTSMARRIRAVFPNAKLIWIVRDGRDVASSLARVPWGSPDIRVNFLVWLFYYWHYSTVRHELRDIHVLRYEDLVGSPDTELRRITDYLELDYEPSLALGYGNQEGVPYNEYPWKWRALHAITPIRREAWRRELSEEDIEFSERVGFRALTSLGYPLATSGEATLVPKHLFALGRNLARWVLGRPFHAVCANLLGLCLPFSGNVSRRAPQQRSQSNNYVITGQCELW